MLPMMRKLEAVGDWTTMRAELTAYLGLDAPIPDEVLARARADDHYASYLLRSRGHPGIVRMLIEAPENQTYRPQASPSVPSSSFGLMAKAGMAGLKWAAGGFQRADEETVARRLNACQSCSHLTVAPDRLVYKVAMVNADTPTVCDACGCVVSRKAVMKDEACPVTDPDRPGWTLWREPVGAGG